MNRKMVLSTLGSIIRVEGLLLLLPAAVSLYYRESAVYVFVLTAVGAFVLGTLLKLLFKPKNNVIYAKEGFVIVSAAWILLSLIGAIPFTAGGYIPSYIDAIFETVSGFTTTGASILTDVEAMGRGALFWRSFTHWVGGMGFLVFVIAITQSVSDRSIHILKAEVPGPIVGKLVPRVKQTAKILYLIYIALTVIEIILLSFGDMTFYESVVHSFGTAGTGGFGIKGDSIASYSAYSQWVIAIFMILFGINFNLYYLILIRRFKSALKSSELWCYISILAISSTVIAININSTMPNVSESVRTAVFQVSSIMTTTGFATANFDLWPELSKAILVILMLIGACAGSTGGGIKVSRVVLLFKIMGREVKKLIHPRLVKSVHFEGRQLDEATLNGVAVYGVIYFVCLLSVFILISFEKFGLETNLTATIACFNNIGPGLAQVGPSANYSAYTDFSKLVLSFAMLFGRLEIYPFLISFSPSTWTKK